MWIVVLVVVALSGCGDKTNEEEKCPAKPIGSFPEVSVKDPTKALLIDEAHETCKRDHYSRMGSDASTKCIGREIHIDGSEAYHLGKSIGSGSFGTTHFTQEPTNFVIKLAVEKEDGIASMCDEKASYRYLEGLNGAVPTLHKIDSISPECEKRVLVMSRLGDANWDQVSRKIDGWLYRRMARLLEIIRDLHDLGMLHFDIKGDNIRVNIDNPDDVFLIDFGNSMSYVDENGKVNALFSGKHDLEMLIDMLKRTPVKDKAWFKELKREVACLERTERFNYEKWTKCFTVMATQNLRGPETCTP